MIRLAGGLLVIASASLFGFRAADALEEEYRQMQDLRRIVYMLQGEIRYARSFLSEAFLTIALDQEEPYRSWLRCLQEKMDMREEGSLPWLWEETARAHLGKLALKEGEKRRLYALGHYLGYFLGWLESRIRIAGGHSACAYPAVDLAMDEVSPGLRN